MINYFFSTEFDLSHKSKVSLWLTDAVNNEGYAIEDLVFNFYNDEALLKINKEFLNHDTLTDVITFDYSTSKQLSAEVFISVERVRENALEFHQDFDNEVMRVMIHGILHLCGYTDKTAKEKEFMSKRENFYLNLFS